VVFPAPFGPRNPKTSPRPTSKSIPRTASFDPYDFRNPRTVIAGAGIRVPTILDALKLTYPHSR
jgi:hypothetical protein